jgi:hypothetical protein
MIFFQKINTNIIGMLNLLLPLTGDTKKFQIKF